MKKSPLILLAVLGNITANPAYADSVKLTNPANGHSYQRFDVTKTWLQAKNACANQSGYLATITSQAENDWVWNNFGVAPAKYYGYIGFWLGASDATNEGQWAWNTGETWSYSNWDTGQPDNGGGRGQSYLAMWNWNVGGSWDDGGLPNDNPPASYLCEWNSSKPVLKQSWQIPAVHYCSADRVNPTNRGLTSKTCFNNIKGATIKVFEIGEKTRMNILVNPTNQRGGFFFKMTYPSALQVSGFKIVNSEPIPVQENGEVAEVLLLVADEAIDKVLGAFNLPFKLIQILYPINPVGDPSFLELLPPDSILSKELYPYQTIERHFQRPSPGAAITIQVDSDVPFTQFKKVMDLQKMSFYIGSDINNELLVEKLKSR
ncbi:MAG: hypothetical protein K9L60_13375 [Methylovulum sp.]|nr:hypothetical protein [Methylovulum sp.]